MSIIYKKTQGFTLIELLLYLSLAVIMLSLLGGIGVHVLSSRVKARAQEELQYNAVFITEKIRASIDASNAIVSPASGESGTLLTLTMQDPTKDPTIIGVQDGAVRLQEGDGPVQVISTGNVVVSQLDFHNVSVLGSPDSVQTTLYLEAYNPHNRSDYAASATFRTTATLRFTP